MFISQMQWPHQSPEGFVQMKVLIKGDRDEAQRSGGLRGAGAGMNTFGSQDNTQRVVSYLYRPQAVHRINRQK